MTHAILDVTKRRDDTICIHYLEDGKACSLRLKPEEIVEMASPKIATTPKVVCLCGSTRFGDAFAKANFDETLAGNIVLTIGCNTKSDAELFAGWGEKEMQALKTKLDELHKHKIDLADEILVLNVGGYIGDSTRSEIQYAQDHGKRVRWLEPDEVAKAAGRI